MINVVIVSDQDLQGQLRGTLLFRSNVSRTRATGLDGVLRAARAGKVDVVLLDAALPDAPALAAAMRREPRTRGLSIAGLERSEFGLVPVELLESGVNAVFPAAYAVKPIDRLRLGLSILSPSGAVTGTGVDYGDRFVGRYGAIDAKLSSIMFAPALAYEFNDALSVGVGGGALYTAGAVIS